jgi:hypothetical protein
MLFGIRPMFLLRVGVLLLFSIALTLWVLIVVRHDDATMMIPNQRAINIKCKQRPLFCITSCYWYLWHSGKSLQSLHATLHITSLLCPGKHSRVHTCCWHTCCLLSSSTPIVSIILLLTTRTNDTYDWAIRDRSSLFCRTAMTT